MLRATNLRTAAAQKAICFNYQRLEKLWRYYLQFSRRASQPETAWALRAFNSDENRGRLRRTARKYQNE